MKWPSFPTRPRNITTNFPSSNVEVFVGMNGCLCLTAPCITRTHERTCVIGGWACEGVFPLMRAIRMSEFSNTCHDQAESDPHPDPTTSFRLLFSAMLEPAKPLERAQIAVLFQGRAIHSWRAFPPLPSRFWMEPPSAFGVVGHVSEGLMANS